MNQRGDAQDGSGSSDPESLRRPSAIRYYLAVLQRMLYSKHPRPAPVQPTASPGLAPPEHYRLSLPPTPPPSPVVDTIFHLQHQAPLSCPADRIVPSFIRPWNGFETTQRMRLDVVHGILPDSATVLPSLDHLADLESLMQSDSQNADVGSKLVQIFFHYAVEVPVAQMIGVLNGLPLRRPLDLMGNVFFPSHLDTSSTSMAPPRTVEEREQHLHWLIPSQSYVYRRQGDDPRTNVPICVNQYHSPDDLNLSQLQAGLESLSRLSEPLTNAHFGRLREVGDSPNWTFEERKALLAVTNAYTVMIKSNLTFGLVATGDAILFLTLDALHPNTLFFKLMNPTVDDIKIEGGHISSNSAAAAQCLSFYLHVLLEAFQREKYPHMGNRRACYCNRPIERVCPPILRRGPPPPHHPEPIASPPRLAANWPPHLSPPEPPPVPVYAQSLQVPLTLAPSPNTYTGVVTSVNSQHLPPSTIVWTRSYQGPGQNTPCFPVANTNMTAVQGMQASRDWSNTPFVLHQPALPPIALYSAGASADNLNKLPPIASVLMGLAAQKHPVALGAVQAGSPSSHLPTFLPIQSHRSQPYRNVHIVSPDEEMTRRLAVNVQRRQGTFNQPPQTGGLQSLQTSEGHQPGRNTVDGRDGYNNPGSDEAAVKLEHGDEKANSTGHQKGQSVPTHALPRSTGGSPTASSPDAASNPYCTHLCLLGLIAGQFTDLDCPNVDGHRRPNDTSNGSDRRHKISYGKFLDLVTNSFHQANEKSHALINDDVIKVTLSGYKYTFVCKRFEQSAKPAMDHEVAVFNRLSSLQGKHVPILLGQVTLRQRVGDSLETGLVHYTLMSSAGAPLLGSHKLIGMDRDVLAQRAGEIVRAFHKRGVSFRATLRNTFFDHFQETVAVAGLGSARMFGDARPPPRQKTKTGTKKRAREDVAALTLSPRGTPRKKRRTERGAKPVIEVEPMDLSVMARIWAQGRDKVDAFLNNLRDAGGALGSRV
ncbi:unnamed protein product [Clonostachys byssicola]|uniref:Uncharacterized protein n=1 Tax=Clonostachys byssicola TaxID=160290 RepID=A0A9N9Y0B7_9HYPO|nr:unnamed protein product [Clonostachys byssicola]